ncbi:VCBS repeat-containing protein, partial [Candidatus Woesearchaeota archaeon]|nr:VCBS repeat-containing protein [Candidatus Woesearchaeota archaeon]
MKNRILHTRKAELTAMLIVISVIAIMGAGAFILGGGITGLQVRDNTTDEVVSAWATTNVNAGFTCPYDASTTGERYLFRSGVTTCETTQDAITIDANDITIECEDGARFVGAGNGVGIVSYSYSNVKIINCDISGFATGIFVSTGDDWSIEDNNIHDIEGWGISFYGTDDSNITRNSLDDFYSGSGAANSIRIISYSNDNNISFNTFSGRMNSGIYFSESSTNYVTSNTFSPSPEHSAVRIDENSDHIYVSYNDFLTTGAANGAVYVEGDYSHIWLNNFYSQDITISGTTNYELCGLESNDVMQNTFGNYYGDSLSAPSGACDPQYKATLPEPYDPEEGLPLLCGATVLGPITLTEDLQDQDPDTSDQQCLGNGLIIGADNVFIDCGESDNFQITGNDEDNDFGIGPDGDYDNLEIRNCDVSGFGHGYSSDIYTTTGTINVHHNIFHDNVYGGVDAENFDDDVAISNNEIYSNGNVGIWVAGTPNTQVIDNNQIRENGGYGLYIDAASSEITDNEIYGNLDGIYVNNRDYTRIEDNNIYDNTNNGIDVFSDTSSVTNTLIGRNTLNNTGTGFDLVWNLGDSTNHIYLNHFYGNGVDDSFSNDYCVDGGNFYRHDMPTVRIGTDDCGPSEIECPVLGTPTFNEWSATQHEITTSTRYFDVEIADFNNDGYDDVVATLDSGGLHLWRNSGSGFSLVDLVGSVHYHVAVGDLNGDDLVDIVAADNTNGIFWWRNNGFSDFTEIGLSPSPESANAAEIADMNNDGLLDIVVGYTSGVDLVWFENQGGEQFNQHPISSSLQFLGDIALADLNSDGYMDIVCAERSANQIVWFRSNAGLTFTEDSMPTSFDYPDSVYVYDLNNDGHMDIVAASSVEDHISWWENFGIGNFGGENILTPDVAISYGVAAYDLDSDGDNDVIAASRSSPHLVWWENREGAFHQHTIDDTLTSRDRLALGDMNNDGDIDVVAVAESNDGIYWWSLVEPNITSGPNRCPSTVLPIGNPPEGMVENTFYNISEINITWTEQDHSPALPITYAVDIIDGLETTLLGTIDTLLMSWDVSGVMESHEYDVAVTPNDGTVNGTIAPSDTFSISNDADNDGYSVLTQFQESDSWDCDDQNIDIHQPVSRENITEAGLCYNTVEDDCDGLTDWLDTGCGNSFTPGSFDDTIYIDGSIIDIETCELATGGYLALIDNPYGKVEYFTPTNLSGVNLDAIFDIDHNSIDVDPTATNGDRFNKQATVTFYNL